MNQHQYPIPVARHRFQVRDGFQSSRPFDTKHCTFAQVGRDQTTINHYHTPVIPPSAILITSREDRPACDVASNLLAEIIYLLADLEQFSVDYRYLRRLVFKPLHQTLFLAGMAIQCFQDTPLGPNLAVSINQEVQHCCIILLKILDNVENYRRVLYSTPIRALWPQVLWSGYQVHEMVWKLSAHQRSIGRFLVALNS